MLGFVTSLRARALARDWSRHSWLLARAVASMLASADSQVVVVGTEPPDIPLDRDSRLTFLPVDLPVPEKTFDAMCTDKVLKVSAGIAAMKARGVDYVALCDADDLVSNKIGSFVQQHRGAAGWYTPALTMYAYGSRWVRRRVPPGTNTPPFAVVRADLLHLVEPPFTGWWVENERAIGNGTYVEVLTSRARAVCPFVAAGHNYYREFMARQGEMLVPLPFDAHLMINHDDSVSTAADGPVSTAVRGVWSRVRGAHRWLPQLRPLTAARRREFAIPDVIPAGYEGGSVLWR
jgi:hypothetical protein